MNLWIAINFVIGCGWIIWYGFSKDAKGTDPEIMAMLAVVVIPFWLPIIGGYWIFQFCKSFNEGRSAQRIKSGKVYKASVVKKSDKTLH